MREIKFKAKRVDGKGWIGGNLVMVCDGETLDRFPHIVISYDHDTFDWIQVIPETVCQFIGLVDKNGTKVFEGDLFKDVERRTMVIQFGEYANEYHDDAIGFYGITPFVDLHEEDIQVYDINKSFLGDFEVSGNIHD